MTDRPHISETLAKALRDLDRELGGHNGPSRRSRPDHGAQIAELEGYLVDYRQGVARFRLGDLVTPKKSGGVLGVGEPHMVVEINHRADWSFSFATHEYGPGSSAFGARYDIRIMSYNGRHSACHWVESWQLEPYTGPATKGAAS